MIIKHQPNFLIYYKNPATNADSLLSFIFYNLVYILSSISAQSGDWIGLNFIIGSRKICIYEKNSPVSLETHSLN